MIRVAAASGSRRSRSPRRASGRRDTASLPPRFWHPGSFPRGCFYFRCHSGNGKGERNSKPRPEGSSEVKAPKAYRGGQCGE